MAAVLFGGLVLAASAGCPPRPEVVSIGEIQGAGHRSPLEGRTVAVTGVVVAEGSDEERPMCWIEGDDDGDPATSRGIFVLDASAEVGSLVVAEGTVRELGADDRDLGVTALVATRLEVVGAESLPEPTELGPEGRALPSQVVDDDALESFEPETDGLDFWESLEGMRVRVPQPTVVGAIKRGSFHVLAAGTGETSARTAAGGIRLRADDENPEIVAVADRLAGELPEVAVGDAFEGPIDGIVHYRRGRYEVLPAVLPRVLPAVLPAVVGADEAGRSASSSSTVPQPERGRLRLGTANLLNLAATDEPEKFARLAEQIVDLLGAPDLLSLQEVQDDSGEADDGTVGAARTLELLADAIEGRGGPRYAWVQIDPVDNADGGQPGGNIRTAFLYDPRILTVRERAGDPESSVRVVESGGVEPSPGRLLGPAFTDADGRSPSRKPLVVEFEVAGSDRPLFALALHLRSKGSDDSLWGAAQPPMRHSEPQRIEQARGVAALVEEILARDPDAHVAVLGDLNEYEFRPPLAVLRDAGLVDLVEMLPPEERYTYIFRGNSMVLDHVLVSRALAEDARVAALHVNAGQPAARQASDHDPLVASVRLPR